MEKPADTRHPIHPLLARRWSPRAFAPRPLEPATIRSLLEAAAWAPSSRNAQPWRFILASREEPETFERILNCLNENNRSWARNAGLLLVALARLTVGEGEEERENRHARHDVGQALAHLSVEATARDLFVHQMGGFSRECVREQFEVPDGIEPVTAVAIGHYGDIEALPEALQRRERGARRRRPLREWVFGAGWGEPHPVIESE